MSLSIFNFTYILFSGILAYFYCICLTPIVKKIGLKFNLFDTLEKRKNNNRSLIRVGGLGIIISLSLVTIPTLLFSDLAINKSLSNILILGSLGYFSLGLMDDIYNLSSTLRLIIQLSIATFISLSNFSTISSFSKTFLINHLGIVLNEYFLIILSIFWLVGIINALNWIDGLDGLLSINCTVFGSGIFIISLFNGNIDTLFFSSITCGVCLGFLKFNKYPAKILLGDGGSYLLGYLLSVLSICSIFGSNPEVSNTNLIRSLLSLLFLLFVPIMDMLRVIFLRLKKLNSPFKGDRKHLHYILIDRGINHQKVVNIICSTSIISLIPLFYLLNLPIKNIFAIVLICLIVIKNSNFKMFI